MKKALLWSVRDGCLVNFWNDNWLRDIGPLKRHYIYHRLLDEAIQICDATGTAGFWNVQWLISVLTYNMVQQILAHKAPERGAGMDVISWWWQPAGRFSLVGT